MKTIQVQTASHTYPIYIRAGALSALNDLLSQHLKQRAFVLTNSTIAEHYLQPLLDNLQGYDVSFFLMDDGEQFKNFDTYQRVMSAVVESELGRDGVLIALGGGVVGDMAGFVAATYQRGIDFIQIPTTLLAQVDSSVGGKTAINHASGKNLVGAFHQPQAVLIDPEVLATLPAREFSAGLAEVIKYGIMADEQFFCWLESNLPQLMEQQPDKLEEAIARSCSIKAQVVAGDEREKGQRALLNLGHTFGHAIEAATGYTQWLHGEAVATGMLIACRLAGRMNLMTTEQTQRVEKMLQAASLPLNAPESITESDWLRLMGKDKKVQQGQIRFILPHGLGDAEIHTDVSHDDLFAAIFNH